MSMWTHEREVRRLLDSPKHTKLWAKYKNEGCWTLLVDFEPKWSDNAMYIVDDKHAEIRKEWIDKGKPQVEFYYHGEWSDSQNEPDWYIEDEYRLKKYDWTTPEGEDTISYHAKRFEDNGGGWYISVDYDNCYAITCTEFSPVGVVLMSKDVCVKIVDALNNGELKL